RRSGGSAGVEPACRPRGLSLRVTYWPTPVEASRNREHWMILVVGWLSAATSGGMVGSGCEGPPGEPSVLARCDPSEDAHCTAYYRCCSDDPATVGPEQEPLFSEANNDRSRTGMCIEIGAYGGGLDTPEGCPIPCNPTWDDDRIHDVCGAAS